MPGCMCLGQVAPPSKSTLRAGTALAMWHASCIERGQTSVGHDTPRRRRHQNGDQGLMVTAQRGCAILAEDSGILQHNAGKCGYVVDWFACRVLVRRGAGGNSSAGPTRACPGYPIHAVGGPGCANRSSPDRPCRSAPRSYPAARLAARSVGLGGAVASACTLPRLQRDHAADVHPLAGDGLRTKGCSNRSSNSGTR